MTFNCILNEKHKWEPTGNEYRLWSAVYTGGTCPPEGAPLYEEQKCCRCGSLRHVIVKDRKENA